MLWTWDTKLRKTWSMPSRSLKYNNRNKQKKTAISIQNVGHYDRRPQIVLWKQRKGITLSYWGFEEHFLENVMLDLKLKLF